MVERQIFGEEAKIDFRKYAFVSWKKEDTRRIHREGFAENCHQFLGSLMHIPEQGIDSEREQKTERNQQTLKKKN